MNDNNKTFISSAQLRSFNDDQLTVLFHSNYWSHLDNDSKLNACQELENRLAAENNIAPREITPEIMDGKCYGYQQGDKIAVNSDMLNDSVFRVYLVDKYDNIIKDEHGNPTVLSEHEVPAVSWNVYNTIAHEHTHGFRYDNGTQARTYFSDDYDLYRIQQEEKVAYAIGDSRTLSALERAEQLTGIKDSTRGELIESIKNDSFQKVLNLHKISIMILL